MDAVSPILPVPTVPAAFPPTVTEADAAAFRHLEGKLSPGWNVQVEPEPGFEWCATVKAEGWQDVRY